MTQLQTIQEIARAAGVTSACIRRVIGKTGVNHEHRFGWTRVFAPEQVAQIHAQLEQTRARRADRKAKQEAHHV